MKILSCLHVHVLMFFHFLSLISALGFRQTDCCMFLDPAGLNYMSTNEMPIVFPFASRLKKLDLLYALLDTEDHCHLLSKCSNLEVLETRNVIWDRGMEVLAQFCKKLKRLRIERGDDEQEMEDEEGIVSQRGLTTISQGCLDLQYIYVYVSDITNATLESMGMHLKNLDDFRMVLLDREDVITDLPLTMESELCYVAAKSLEDSRSIFDPEG